VSPKKTVVVEVSTTKVLDSTPAEAKKAKQALELLASAKRTKALAEKAYEEAQAELYTLLAIQRLALLGLVLPQKAQSLVFPL